MARVYQWVDVFGTHAEEPAATHNIQLFRDSFIGWTFERALANIECQYSFAVTPVTPLPYWKPTAFAMYWLHGPGRDTPRELSDGGGDYSHYQGFGWDQDIAVLSVDVQSVLYYAPRNGMQFDVRGRRRLVGLLGVSNALWLSVGTALSGSPGSDWSAREFAFAYTLRCLFSREEF